MKSRVSRIILAKQAGKLILAFSAWLAALMLLGGLPARPALVVAFALASTGAAIAGLERQTDFAPYEIAIHPHWHVILDEMSIYPQGSDDERVAWFRERLHEAGPAAERLLEEGLRITFVTRGTAYIHHISYFMSKVNVRARLLQLDASRIDQWVGVFVTAGRTGYELGMILPEPSTISHGRGEEPLAIGVIPWSLLRMYNWWVDAESTVRADLVAAGWDMHEGNFLVHVPFSISNHFVRVTIRTV